MLGLRKRGARKSRRPKSFVIRLIDAGADPKAVYGLVAAFSVLMLAFCVFAYLRHLGTIAVASALIALFAGDYLIVSTALSGKKKLNESLESEFVEIFDYFGIYVLNGVPVYTALQNVVKFASPKMADRLRALLDQIDSDKTVKPYVDFASGFDNLSIRQVMVSVYLMSEEGGSEAYINQFHALFDSLSADKKKAEKERRIDKLSNLCVLPLVGSAVTMGMIMVGIMNIVGGVMNGI
jgi:Flp pilus assembly protein TadB